MVAAQQGTVLGQFSAEAKSSARSATPPLMDADDFLLDFAEIEGRDVRVRGVGFYMMDVFQQKKSMSDLSLKFVDTSGLPRDDRKKSKIDVAT